MPTLGELRREAAQEDQIEQIIAALEQLEKVMQVLAVRLRTIEDKLCELVEPKHENATRRPD